MSYTIGKPDCACGHAYFLHMPKCIKCECTHYVSKHDVTITDKIEKEDAAAKATAKEPETEKKKPSPREPDKNEVQKFICPSCYIIETISIHHAPPLFHRHEKRLYKLVPFPITPENSQ